MQIDRVQLMISGGIAGLLRRAELPGAELAPEERQALQFHAARTGAPKADAGARDLLTYELEIHTEGDVQRVTGIVEKPKPEEAPTTQAVVGRYILTPRIFDHIRALKPGAGGEYQLTDAIAGLLRDEAVLSYQFKGVRYDCGSKLGYLKASVELALRHPEVGEEFAAYLASRG